jgi:hypothetical protein
VSEFIPTVDDIGALLRTRTKDKYGSEVGTFNADTRPTDEDVLILIQAAYDTVVALSDTDIPKACWHSARTCIAIKAAMLVELSYWPDQIPLNQSPYAALRVEFEGANGDGGELAALHACSVRESEEEISGELPPTNSPVYSFEPRGYDVGQGTIW